MRYNLLKMERGFSRCGRPNGSNPLTFMKTPPARRRLSSSLIRALTVIAWLAASSYGAAQPKPDRPKKPEAPEIVSASPETIVILIRTTLLSLNDAMRTGNYTVLRDVASPSFREANSAGRLSQIFANVAAKNLDLAAVAILAPQLSPAPSIDQNKRLHISGYFPGNPVQLNFELMFEPVNGQWRLFGLSVVPAPATSTNASAAPANGLPLTKKASRRNKDRKQRL
jgi:hypothetical protein